jgi:hypothetical protein
MNPSPFIKVFAWISIVGLGCAVFIDDWLPLLIVAIAITVFYKMFT